jgi:sugar phosphate isomerase/epimerase
LKLGFTTNTFSNPLKTGELKLEDLVKGAAENGFQAVEIRDNAANLDEDRVIGLGELGRDHGVELTYAIRNDLLAENDRELYDRGVKRAGLIGGGRLIRILAAQGVLKEEGRKGYTGQELGVLAKRLEEYGRLAASYGVLVAVEHAREPLWGDGKTYYGIGELIGRVKEDNVGLTFDPANATTTKLCLAPAQAEEVYRFMEEYGERIFLVHFKTTLHGEVQPTLVDGDLDVVRIVEGLNGLGYRGVFCIEVPGEESGEGCWRRLKDSVSYLRERGLAGYFE